MFMNCALRNNMDKTVAELELGGKYVVVEHTALKRQELFQDVFIVLS